MPTSDFSYLWNKDKSAAVPASPVTAPEKKERTQRPDTAVPAWGFPSVLLSAAVMLGAQVVLTLAVIAAFPALIPTNLDEPISPIIIGLSSVVMYAAWVGVMAYVSKKRGLGSWKLDFWLAFKKKDFLLGPAIAIGMFLLFQGLSIMFSALGVDMSGADNGAQFGPGTGVGGLVIAIAIASLAGPIAEELFFRGHLLQGISNSLSHLKTSQSRIRRNPPKFVLWLERHRYIIAAILSSIAFGAVHTTGEFVGFSSVFLMLATGSLGFVMSLLVLKTRRLGPAITTHVAYNSVTLIAAYTLASL